MKSCHTKEYYEHKFLPFLPAPLLLFPSLLPSLLPFFSLLPSPFPSLPLLLSPPSLSFRDTNGRTPLHFAAASGHVSVVGALMHAGGNPSLPDKHGFTPIHWAAYNGRSTQLMDVEGGEDTVTLMFPL